VTQTPIKNTRSKQKQVFPSDILIKHEDSMDCSDSGDNDRIFQTAMLNGVSRTFALTIPRLPAALRDVVSNAYLLCRTIDTIEDEPKLTTEQKRQFSDLFLKILENTKQAEALSTQLSPLLGEHTNPAEHQLVHQLNRVVKITRQFQPEQQHALMRCVRVMCEGMIYFQEHSSADGLKDQEEMDKYCYHVAGVVGEMLTTLFCHYSEEIAGNRKELLVLSKSFGQGLQMTNILKDIWDDQNRGACWLPRDLFERHGLNLNQLDLHSNKHEFHKCIKQLVGIAHGHLENALKYTLMIPSHEKGIREFCLWALGMAMLTLRSINGHPGFTDGSQVKISRRSVKATVMVTGIALKNDTLLTFLFKSLGKGLPKMMV
jgi:farnesyl-diphosphate farnesyltransferase